MTQDRKPNGRRPRVPEGMRVYAIGDIHGRSDLLDQIHKRIKGDIARTRPSKPILVYIGDYIDRGPDSAGVIERLQVSAFEDAQRIFIKGNHEEIFEKFLAEPETITTWRHLGGLDTLMSYGIDFRTSILSRNSREAAEDLRRKLPFSHQRFFASLQFSAVIGDYFFCHAGARPGIPLDLQIPGDLLWIRQEFLASNHNFEKVVVHGHTPAAKPEFLGWRINIDTGACITGKLTCLVLQDDSQSIISTGT